MKINVIFLSSQFLLVSVSVYWWMKNLKKADIPAACSLPPHEGWGLQWAQAKVFLIHPPEAPPLLDSN